MATNSLLEHIFANGIDLGTGVLAYGSAGVRASGTHFGAITNAKGIGLVSHSESNVSAYFVENVVSGGSYASILQPEDSEQPVITYSVVAKGKTIMFSGSAQFVNDTAVVNFDEDMANLIEMGHHQLSCP